MSSGFNHRELIDLAFAVCDGVASEEQIERVEEILTADPAARLLYLQCLEMHFDMDRRHGRGTSVSGEMAGGQPSVAGQSEFRNQTSEIPGPHSPHPAPEPLIAPIVIDTSPLPPPPLLSTLFAPGGWAFSYGVSAAILGIAILIGLAWRVSHDSEVVRSAPRQDTPTTELGPESVGQITGMADCRWTGAAPSGKTVPLGRRYALRSGLMEITYQTGARVILEGPCTYEVDSTRGGFLSLGKLTARVETKAEGGGGKAEGVTGQNSPFPPPPSPFVVRTPTAVVTDLGTEFGVEVNEAGHTESHVFVGRVKIVPTGFNGAEGETTLGAGQSARCQNGERIVIVPATAAEPGRFVRSLRPETIRIVEKFDGPKLGAAFEQTPPGRYALVRGAAVYQQPPDKGGRQSRGYIRTVATDFCNCDFVCEATIDVRLDAPDLKSLKHEIFFGIGSGEPNPNLYDEMTCGLAMVFVVDTGRIYVQTRRPDCAVGQPFKDADDIADFAPSGALGPGRHRLQMVKRGKWLQFFVDADFNGRFEADFQTRWLDLAAVMPLLDSTNSRLALGTGNCDTMTVRFEDLSIIYAKRGGTVELPPRDGAATQQKGGG